MIEACTSYNRIIDMSVRMEWSIRKSMAIFKLGEQLPLLKTSLHEEDPELCLEWTKACSVYMGYGMTLLAQKVIVLTGYEAVSMQPISNYQDGPLTVSAKDKTVRAIPIRTEFHKKILDVLLFFVLPIKGNSTYNMAIASAASADHLYYLGNLVPKSDVNFSLQRSV